jgi:cyanophycin synthetase
MAAGSQQPADRDRPVDLRLDGKTNPLRTNVFDVRGVTVIVDYAHNPAAYAALAEMARALLPGQLVGIVTAPGDRRDSDLLQIGRVCASASTSWWSTNRKAAAARGRRGRPDPARRREGGRQDGHDRTARSRSTRRSASACRCAARGDVLVFRLRLVAAGTVHVDARRG